jgi:outer membrane protein insertion porin family
MRRWSVLLALAGFVLLGLTPLPVLADGSGMVVTGNHRVEADTIRSYFHSRDGKTFEALDIDAGVKALYATALFSDVRVSQRAGVISVVVVENPTIGRIAFEGNKHVKDEDLRKAVASKERGPLAHAQVQKDVAALVALYQRQARFDTSVDPKVIQAGEHRVNLLFEIKEGARTGVRQVLFTGNKAYSATQLKGTIKTGQTNLLSALLGNDVYDPDKVEADREQIRRFYLAHGYADIRVAPPAAQYDPEHKGFVVTYAIEEGARYRVGKTEVTSQLADIDADTLRSELSTNAGDTLNADAVEKTVSALSARLAREGEPFANVRVSLDRVRGGDTIDLRYIVEPGPRVYVERIAIHGNTKTRDAVIRREFDFAEGDAYNAALVSRAERRLKNLGYFKTVAISKQPGSTDDRVIVDVALEEEQTGNFQIAGGYSTMDGPIAEISVTERNFMGRGESAKASVTYGEYAKGFELAFTEPYILDTRASLGIDLFGRQSVANSYQSFDTSTVGGKLILGLPMNEQIGAQWNYALYRQSVTLDPSLGTASLPIQEAAAAGPAWVSSIGTGVTYSTLDNNRNPTSGWRLGVNEEFAGFGGDAKFAKTTEDARYYYPIADGVTGMVRAQSGYVAPWGGQPLPLLSGFFGGPSLVRGFAANGIGPRDVTPGTTMDNIGGNIYWGTSAEVQSAVPFIPSDAGLKAAFFADAGSLWRTGSAGSSPALSQSLVSNPQTIRSSFGAGLVWDSILGPIRIDYAYPTTKAATDITQRLRFSAGGF